MAKIYALYKGDEYIADGTLEELAEKSCRVTREGHRRKARREIV